jgi:hypothetical protein
MNRSDRTAFLHYRNTKKTILIYIVYRNIHSQEETFLERKRREKERKEKKKKKGEGREKKYLCA